MTGNKPAKPNDNKQTDASPFDVMLNAGVQPKQKPRVEKPEAANDHADMQAKAPEQSDTARSARAQARAQSREEQDDAKDTGGEDVVAEADARVAADTKAEDAVPQDEAQAEIVQQPGAQADHPVDANLPTDALALPQQLAAAKAPLAANDMDGSEEAAASPAAAAPKAAATPQNPPAPQAAAQDKAAVAASAASSATEGKDFQAELDGNAPDGTKPGNPETAEATGKGASTHANANTSAAISEPASQAAAPQAQQAQIQPPASLPAGAVPAAPLVQSNAALPNIATTVQVAPHEQAPDVDALAVSIAAKSLSGARQFDIRLDPPELGHVEVRLSIDAAGKAQAHMTADKPETLALLQKDSSSLTQALRDAGLDVSGDGLNFSLRGGKDQGERQDSGARRGIVATKAIDAVQSASAISYSGAAGDARLDIHV